MKKREIKFRAWNKKTLTMIDLKKITPLALSIEQDGVFVPFSENYELMQYTGLKDKNGKEIYEGDICKGTMPDSEQDEDFEQMEVRYEEGEFSLYRLDKNNNGLYFGSLIAPVLNKCIEVIGNIYENPEILKKI